MGRRPRLPGWSFQQLICGGVLPPPHCPDKSGPAVSPTDKLRKDSALRLGRAFRSRVVRPGGHSAPSSRPRGSRQALGREARRGLPVTSEKSTLFIGVTKIVRFCKVLSLLCCEFRAGIPTGKRQFSFFCQWHGCPATTLIGLKTAKYS